MSRSAKARAAVAARLGQGLAWAAWLMLLHGAVLELDGDATTRARVILFSVLAILGAWLLRLRPPSARVLVGASVAAALALAIPALLP